ncbi:MAG: hypothetical protein O2877_02885 [bacterium]|nr:hypothetical protein [bacterium]
MDRTPLFDAKVKTILDAALPGERVCDLTGEKWDVTEEELGWYRHFNVPPSKLSPVTRMKINTSFYNGFQWWNQKHPKTGKTIITGVHPSTGIKVLPDKEWHEKDFSENGIEVDLNRSFFEQMRELQLRVPLPASRNIKEPENSISLASSGDRNSYFMVATISENSLYSVWCNKLSGVCEVNSCDNVSNSYHIGNSYNINNCNFIDSSKDVISSDFIFFSSDLEFCFGASLQKHKRYLWFNEQLTKEEWEKRRAEVDLGSRKVLDENIAKFRKMMVEDTAWPENFNETVENCTGELIFESEDISEGYFVNTSKNGHWVAYLLSNCEGNAYMGGGKDSTNNYYSHSPMMSSGCKFVHSCYSCQNVEYSMQCYNCEDLFGCVGLNRKRFCIFNKQYTEDEYYKKLDEVKTNMLERGEYGDFFPLSFSPCYFFATPALAWLIDEKDAEQLGAAMYDLDSMGARGDIDSNAPMTDVSELPDHVKDFGEWSGKALKDKLEGKRFAYIKPEITLYQKLNIAPPLENPMLRLRNLSFEVNSAIPMEVTCAKTGKKLRVAKNKMYPDRKIYCREAYLEYLETNG